VASLFWSSLVLQICGIRDKNLGLPQQKSSSPYRDWTSAATLFLAIRVLNIVQICFASSIEKDALSLVASCIRGW
jgi:hypothetical protein